MELLYDRPIPDASRVRVAGPFTVESLSPHRMVPADEDDMLADPTGPGAPVEDFAAMILEQLRAAGVQQSAKEDRITFDALDPWPGEWLGAQGTYTVPRADGTPEARRAGILIGPEFGTLTRTDLTAAAREAVDTGFDLLIACGFAFDAHSSELTKLGPLPILKARMNPDLHMSADLKATGAGNLFVVFGEPDVSWTRDAEGRIAVTVHGVDVFDPKTTEVRASGKDEIAAWFIDTDYDEEAFHVRHAYFTGANDPYKSLKTTLRDEIDRDAWETLNRLTSRPFAPPETGRFAVKVINHLGDEVMKVFTVNNDG
ncbi:hypothetical protein [uncultured Jannaschia sp.]|uniref:hypothetical protein n=1 Tax=uncultured Jannaschia sp. TaxID=293347 RepID=UPI002610287F|nr:hypothetical protein [uncultured Jannaschia sp.]